MQTLEGLKGLKIIIGGKYAEQCSYDSLVGREAIILEASNRHHPYGLPGAHTICLVDISKRSWRDEWEVHIDDCIIVNTNNKEKKHLLETIDD